MINSGLPNMLQRQTPVNASIRPHIHLTLAVSVNTPVLSMTACKARSTIQDWINYCAPDWQAAFVQFTKDGVGMWGQRSTGAKRHVHSADVIDNCKFIQTVGATLLRQVWGMLTCTPCNCTLHTCTSRVKVVRLLARNSCNQATALKRKNQDCGTHDLKNVGTTVWLRR